MSKSFISWLNFLGPQISIYGSASILTLGLLGDILNLLIFLSLRTFRESSSAFYLIIMSIFNIGQLLVGLLTRVLLYIYGDDGTGSSLFFCKFRLFFSQICVMISLTCFCLATIDQYCGTSSRLRLRQICRIKIAGFLVIIFSVFWTLSGIPCILLYYHTAPSSTGQIKCVATNAIFLQYRIYSYLILSGFLPISIIFFFGLMAYRNIYKIQHHAVPLVRRELDKQITKMILTQVIVSIFTLLPYIITNIVSMNLQNNSNSLVQAQLTLSIHITLNIYYIYFAVSIHR